MAKTDISKLGQDVAWQDVTCGNTIVGCGTTKQFITGDWTNVAPVIDEENSVFYVCLFARTVQFL